MFSFLRQNIGKTIFLCGLILAGIVLLSNSIIKATFVFSHESATQKAQGSDLALGTLSLVFVLLAILTLATSVALVIRHKSFDAKITFKNKTLNFKIAYVLAASALMMLAGVLFVIAKDYANYSNEWRKLSDMTQARNDIAANLAIANTLIDDALGNPGIHFNSQVGKPLLNSLSATEYELFVNALLQSKKDLAAMYPINEIANAGQPLVAARLLDALAAAWQADNNITASSWFASSSAAHSYDFHNIVNTLNFKANGVDISNYANAMNKTLIYTDLTSAYLVGFPIEMTGLALVAASALPLSVAPMQKMFAKGAE